ncbi:MAG: carbohydrate ABC transporter permease [Clostridia bacterium]|nr:carbohydrate ABC transporter permease [Clostridia bacterium]MCI9086645.1 carbohydrate ABC transporter permease [Clostridia bacterium]
MKISTGRKVFIGINGIILFLTVLVTIYPLIYVIFASLSDPARLMAFQGALIKPEGFSLAAYTSVLDNPMIWKGYLNTIIVVILGVSLNMALTIIAAYFFSRRNVYFSKFFMLIVMITMFFSGGMVPTYLLMKDLHLLDTLLALIIPGAINTTNMIIMRTAFYNVPQSLEEAAMIDGAGHFITLTRVILPVILPTVMVITLYYTVGHWNSWFNAAIYIREKGLYPLQLVLREILILSDTSSMQQDSSVTDQVMIGETIKYAVIVVSTLPILCLYPFLQKYFVKGVMVGAVKE